MNKDQEEARACLSKFGPIMDPQYAPHPAKAEKELQETVKRCWEHRKGFPEWIEGYIKKWSAEKSTASSGLDLGTGAGLSGEPRPGAVLT